MEKTIKAAVKRDAMAGNGMDILVITKSGVEEYSKAFEEMGE